MATAENVPGPFDPPADYEFEEELQGETPRPRAPELATGRYAVGRRQLISGCLIAAVVCTAIAPLPFVQECALYILPLEYLFWIGFGLGALAIFLFLRDRFVSGPYEYVERGLPLVARVRSIELRVARIVNEIRYFRYYAQIECLHPESGILQYAERASREVTKRDATTYQAGDYVTAVYLPGKFATSLQLYGFLELRPGLGLVPAEGVRASTWKDVLGLVGFLTALPFGLLWFLYAFTKYSPLHADPLQMTVILVTGGILIGGGLVAWVKIRKQRQPTTAFDSLAAEPRPSAVSRFFQAVFLFLLAVAFGAMITACTGFAINAGFDRSPAISRPVQIDRMVMVTHKFIRV